MTGVSGATGVPGVTGGAAPADGAALVSGTFPLTTLAVPRLIHLRTTGSTNDDLVAFADEASDGTVLISLEQSSGRGRLGRRWEAPSGQMLAASILLRPRASTGARLPADAWGWLPLLAGTALKAALEAGFDAAGRVERDVLLKWPNDVQIGGDKVAGILAQLTTVDGIPDAIVVGIGINLTIARADLPTPTSTSLALEGLTGDAAALGDEVLAAFVTRFRRLVDRLVASGGDAGSSGLREEITAACDTVGRRVRVELPGAGAGSGSGSGSGAAATGTAATGRNVYGTATGLDDSGRLIVLQDDNHGTLTVAAGDVTHLRYE